tara:strand:+ start:993 stop:2003 length:1011 start_codon:yes stop_codon:yes gene_type:complete
MNSGIKKSYLNFIERDHRGLIECILYKILCGFSFIYGFIVNIRNLAYDFRILPSKSVEAKVISVGNLSWSGSGKTPLSIWLFEKFKNEKKTAILRRGYGKDENQLLKEEVESVFISKDRYTKALEKQANFELFILDDGFQHRRLKRDIDIVIMGSREFNKKFRLIPAYFFREPLSSLKRADIVLISHSDEIKDLSSVNDLILSMVVSKNLFFSHYEIKGFFDLDGQEKNIDYFKDKPIAAFAAIGYPEGFFNKLTKAGLKLAKKITYPDHHQLNQLEFNQLEDELLRKGINNLIITRKDKYHLPNLERKINIFIMEIRIVISDEKRFFEEIRSRLN